MLYMVSLLWFTSFMWIASDFLSLQVHLKSHEYTKNFTYPLMDYIPEVEVVIQGTC